MIVLLALGASALSLESEHVIDYRVGSQNLHIDHLEHLVDKLEHDFHQLSRPITRWDVSMLKAQLRNNEGKRGVQASVGLVARCYVAKYGL